MNDFRPAGRLLLALALSFCFAGCAGAGPNKWTLWYIPNEPTGVATTRSCTTYVFASAPTPSRYVVAVFKGWAGTNKPYGATAQVHTGESFTGNLPLGVATIHDDSTGYDMVVTSVYVVDTYVPAKARADMDCVPYRR